MSHLHAQSGQTILELLVALTLIILFLAGVVVVQLFSLRNIQFAQNKSTATALAREQLERARVIRDSSGIDALALCQSSCYINGELTPIPITPTGVFGELLTMKFASDSDCPLPQVTITPQPVFYKATVSVNWGQGVSSISPAPQVDLSSCITDWR